MVYVISSIETRKNSDRLTVLRQVQDKYDYSGLEFPVSLTNIKKIEENNKVCIYVYEIDEETNDIVEAKKGSTKYINEVIYLLFVEQDDKYHYIYIKTYRKIIKFAPSHGR